MSTTITVTSAAELNQALSQASGGETILLAAGNYGKLVINNSQFASNVTIKSADPNAMASFSETYVSNSSNVTFEEIKFDYTYASGDRDHHSPFQINYSSNITIDNSVFDGDLASGTGIGRGLVVRGSTNVDVVNTEFHSWWKALSAAQSTNLDFIGNNIHTIRSDGISLGEVQNVLIENNYIHDFGGLAGSGDHRDMIQIQRASGTGSSDITIRNNVLDIGAGDYAQGIWAGADKGNISDPTHWNYNIVVENNVLYNAHANGIALHMTDGATIANNTVIAVPTQQTGGVAIPKIILAVGSQNITITDNVAPAIVGYTGQSHFNVQNNVITQNTNSSAPGYYDTQFVYHATSATDGFNQYGVVPGSAVDLQNAGSSLVDGYPFSYDNWVGSASTPVNPGGSGTGGTGSTPPGTGTPAPAPSTPDTGPSNPGTPDTDTGTPGTPDAGPSNPGAPDTDTGTPETPDTDSSDTGTSGENPAIPGGDSLSDALNKISDADRAQRSASDDSGAEASNESDTETSASDTPDADTAAPGTPDVEASNESDTETSASDTPDADTEVPNTPDAEASNESETETSAPTESQSQMVFDDFVLDIAELSENEQADLKGDAQVVDTADGSVVHFDGHKDKVKIGRLEQFEDSDQLAFTVEFARDEADGASQRLVWNKGHVGLTLTGDGLKAHVGNNDGKFGKGFLVEDLGLNDTEMHEITLMVDQVEDRLQVLVDDEVVLDRTDIDLDFTGGRERGWDIGVNRKHYVDGDLSGFAIDDEVQFVDTMGGSVDLMG